MLNNMDILARLDATIKSITTTDLGSSKLAQEKANQFVKALSEATPMLKAARRLDMNSHTRDIDRVGFASRISSVAQEGIAPTGESKPNFYTNKLEAKEIIAVVGITDSTLEDNIEREDFENTLLQLMGERVGLDLEELFVKGDKSSSDPFLAVTNGWLKKAANQVKATTHFQATDVEAMFEAQLNAMPKQFLRNRDSLVFYVPFDVENDYRNKLKQRNSALGDIAMTSGQALTYKGIAVEYVANMPAGTALLVPKQNLVYGIYRDIRIEADRQPKARKTDFVLTARVDCHYEDENAAVVATGYTGA